MPDHDAEYAAIVDMLTEAGMVEEYSDHGKPALRLTERGAQMGRALAMAGDEADTVLAALLDARGAARGLVAVRTVSIADWRMAGQPRDEWANNMVVGTVRAKATVDWSTVEDVGLALDTILP